MKKALIWFAGFFEDQAGTASSKRAGAYFGLFLMYMQVKASLAGTAINETVFLTVVAFTFAMWGLTMPEWFSPKGGLLAGAKIETTSTTKTTDTTIKTEPPKPPEQPAV